MNTRSTTGEDIIIGQNLRRMRLGAAFTQDQLAEAIGVSFQQVQKYENGRNRIAAGRLACAVRALGGSIAMAFEGIAA